MVFRVLTRLERFKGSKELARWLLQHPCRAHRYCNGFGALDGILNSAGSFVERDYHCSVNRAGVAPFFKLIPSGATETAALPAEIIFAGDNPHLQDNSRRGKEIAIFLLLVHNTISSMLSNVLNDDANARIRNNG